jgi:type IV pilus assembly protein PilA
MKQVQKGFTLIELMIVVAIIGILAAVAIPAYQDYTIRAQVSEGMSLAAGAKTSVAEYYTQRGTFPADNDEAGMATNTDISGSYVDQVTVNNGVIEVRYGNDANNEINGEVLELSPIANSGSVEWNCKPSASTFEGKFLPTDCRD